MIVTRRTFLTGLIAAPIIVRAGLLMPVKAFADDAIIPGAGYVDDLFEPIHSSMMTAWTRALWLQLNQDQQLLRRRAT